MTYMENSIYIKIPILILWEKCRIDPSATENSFFPKLLVSRLCADTISLSWAAELTRTSLPRPKPALRMTFFFFFPHYLPRRAAVTKSANIPYEKTATLLTVIF